MFSLAICKSVTEDLKQGKISELKATAWIVVCIVLDVLIAGLITVVIME